MNNENGTSSALTLKKMDLDKEVQLCLERCCQSHADNFCKYIPMQLFSCVGFFIFVCCFKKWEGRHLVVTACICVILCD